jgi:hypothetical protein
MNCFFSSDPIQSKINKGMDKDFHKIKADPNCIVILGALKQIKENGKPLFINHILPIDKNHYNSTFENFQDAMLCLYEGRFLVKYNPGRLDGWFKEKYKSYLNINRITEKIMECKNDWYKINILINNTAKNYSKWFDIEKGMYNKNKLTRSVNDWIFNRHAKTSMFYVSLLKPPSDIR